MSAAACTFYLGRFYEGREATLATFFSYHAVLFLFLVPALYSFLSRAPRRDEEKTPAPAADRLPAGAE